MPEPWEGGGAGCAWQVCVYPTAAEEALVFRARNAAPVVATVSLSFELLQNLRLTDSVPIVREVPAGSNLVLTRLRRVDPAAGVDARPRVEIDLGSDSTRHDPGVVYAMPFGGDEPRRLVASYGSAVHRVEEFYALDFAMPEGTPVLAARAGVVALVQDGLDGAAPEGELVGRANLVVVAHADGTLASYGYLRRGVAVAVGDSVARGQLLAYSGSGGSPPSPHLHFHVGTRLIASQGRTIRVPFQSPTGGIHDLREGSWCLPGRREAPGPPRRSLLRGLAPDAPRPVPLLSGAA